MKNSNIHTPQSEVDRGIILALHKLSHVFRDLLWQHTKSFGISPIQIQILLYIAQHLQKENRVTNLARDFNLTPATVSDAVKSLEKKKFLRRTMSRTDKREFLLSLTKSGKVLANKLGNWQEPMLEQLKTFTPDTRQTLSTFLIKYINSLGSAKLLSEAKTCYSCLYFENIGNPRLKTKHFCVFRQLPMQDFDLTLDCLNYERKYE